MKSDKKLEIDPIKAKYIKKIGFFNKIQIKFNNFIRDIKSNKEDIQEFKQMIFDIVLFGAIGNLAMTLPIFGLPFGFLNILAIGSIAWIIENKLVEIFVKILSSINLVKVYR